MEISVKDRRLVRVRFVRKDGSLMRHSEDRRERLMYAPPRQGDEVKLARRPYFEVVNVFWCYEDRERHPWLVTVTLCSLDE